MHHSEHSATWKAGSSSRARPGTRGGAYGDNRTVEVHNGVFVQMSKQPATWLLRQALCVSRQTRSHILYNACTCVWSSGRLVQWSEDVMKADPFFGRSRVRFRVPPLGFERNCM